MNSVYSYLTRNSVISIGFAVFVWLAICINNAQSSDELGTSNPVINADTSGDQFDNPESVIKSFVSQLERLADKEGTISPGSLYKQLAAAKKCDVDITAEPVRQTSGQCNLPQGAGGGRNYRSYPETR